VIKVYCDFNDRTEDECCWTLLYANCSLETQMTQLGLNNGDRVILFQDEGDFEVEAILLVRQMHPYFIGEKLCARPDWTTLRRL
jgi:hypothetical protein